MKKKKQLSSKKMKIFEQYYVGGSDGGQDTKDMQLYLFEGLKKYDSNKRLSAVRNLIDLTINEIQLLYKRKEMFESKTGFVLAFVSIVFVAFLQSGITEVLKYSISNINSTQNACWLLIIISAFISLGFSVGFAVDVLYSKDIFGLSVKDRENNYKNVIDDPDMFYVAMLEIYTEAFEYNNDAINRMSRSFNISIKSAIIFTFLVVVSWLIQ